MPLRPVPVLRGAAAVALTLAAGLGALTACAPEADGPSPSAARPSASGSAGATASATPSPSPSASASVAIPTDCRALLTDAVLAQLGDTPLNHPAYGTDAGVQSDGSLVCIWRDPAADVTGITTEISRMNRGPALDMLNTLADDDGFDCYTPSGGTRCEKSETTPADAQYPGIVQGRTLFWRDGILIDTRYANLAPSGYTDSIVQHLFG